MDQSWDKCPHYGTSEMTWCRWTVNFPGDAGDVNLDPQKNCDGIDQLFCSDCDEFELASEGK